LKDQLASFLTLGGWLFPWLLEFMRHWVTC
jgi:hypothetical protein